MSSSGSASDAGEQTQRHPAEAGPLDTAAPSIGERVGRYVVLEELGAGAMGIVVRAYDPRMRREVALKLVRPGGQFGQHEAQARQLREARALAQLSHPNVVSVYDAEPLGQGVVIAMEFVEGTTFGAWLRERPRTKEAILEVGIAVGAGLSAAHARGLVHRDVKPDNVLIGLDGRVRLTDLGLVHGGAPTVDASSLDGDPAVPLDPELTGFGNAIGTPGYMAPEQHAGAAADPRADQYALCVMLWEALYGARPFVGRTIEAIVAAKSEGPPPRPPKPAPAWLHAALRRGLAPEATERWPSIDALCEALRTGHRAARTRRRLTALAITGVLGLAVAGGMELHRRDEVSACEHGARELADGVWPPGGRQRLHEALVAQGGPRAEATFERVLAAVDPSVERLRELSATACIEAKTEQRWSDEDYAKIEACLGRVRDETAARMALLTTTTEGVLQLALPTAQGTPPPDGCVDRRALDRAPEVPRDPARRAEEAALSRLSIRVNASLHMGRLEEAEARIDELRQRAEAGGFERYVHIATALRGQVAINAPDPSRGLAGLQEAFIAFGAGEHDDLAFQVAGTLVYTMGARLRQPDAGLVFVDTAKLLAGPVVPGEETVDYARLLDAEGAVNFRRGNHEAAIAVHRRALEIVEREYGPDHLDTAMTLTNLGAAFWVSGQLERALEVLQRALEIRILRLGPDHTDVMMARNNVALILEDLGRSEEAEREFRAVLEYFEAIGGPEDPRILGALLRLGYLARVRGDFETSVTMAERGLRLTRASFGPDHPDVMLRLDDLGQAVAAGGDLDRARSLFEEAIALGERILFDDQSELGYPLENLGSLEMQAGHLDQAIAHLERAIALRRTGNVVPSDGARAEYLLAQALWSQGLQRERAVELAREAERHLDDEHHRDIQAEVTAWLAAHADPSAEPPPSVAATEEAGR